MSVPRWQGHHPPDELGAVVHGPRILAGSAAGGVLAGLRCIFAHPAGLHLPVVVAASGIYAEAAERRRAHHLGEAHARENAGEEPAVRTDPLRQLSLIVELNGRAGQAEPYQSQGSWGEDRYDQQADYWIPKLPADGKIGITASWPEIGLPEDSILLACKGLDDLAARVYPLRAPSHDEEQVSPPASIVPVEVPHLVGLTVPAARWAGHEVGLVVTATNPDGPPLGALTWPGTWIVTAQRPAASTRLERGDTVAIEFTRQPDTPGTDA
jgi:hypothetical protein